MTDIIIKKRNNRPLSAAEFDFVAQGAAKGTVPDYQLSAFLMACFLNPLIDKETAAFTKAMACSGGRLDFAYLKKPTVDKHSTGGVGDGISLALAPLVACAGLAVPMMSGRGLGHTGGTLDKLESIKNFNVLTPVKRIYKQMEAIGVCMFGQTANLAPADKKLYALRDATGTVESRPLITASILSKKYAEGARSLIMDVKYGGGAFMQKYADSKKLALALVRTAKLMGISCRALLTDMDTPLGRAIGNANEMLQTILILNGDKNLAPDFYDLLIQTGAHMLAIGGVEKDLKAAARRLEGYIQNGAALQKLKEIIKWHGGNPDVADNPRKYLKNAPLEYVFKTPSAGFIGRIDAKLCGRTAVLLGAGRGKMEDHIDHGSGIWLEKKLGSRVAKGDIIARLYANDKTKLKEGAALFAQAVAIQKNKPAPRPLIREIIK
jgi:pyrimidine-nucleoside phosphorylase